MANELKYDMVNPGAAHSKDLENLSASWRRTDKLFVNSTFRCIHNFLLLQEKLKKFKIL
jgi:hypothetical protein